MTKEEMEELKGLAASMGLYDDKNPSKRAVILGKVIKALEQEPCDDAISRQAINELQKYRYNCGDTTITCVSLASINELPSVTHKTGHWIKIKPYPLQMHDYECSECGHETDDNTENYCSECGTKMEVGKYEC